MVAADKDYIYRLYSAIVPVSSIFLTLHILQISTYDAWRSHGNNSTISSIMGYLSHGKQYNIY